MLDLVLLSLLPPYLDRPEVTTLYFRYSVNLSFHSIIFHVSGKVVFFAHEEGMSGVVPIFNMPLHMQWFLSQIGQIIP